MYIHTSTGEKTVYWVVIRQIGGLFNQHNATNSKSFTGQLLYLLDYRAYTWQITAKSRTNVHLADNNNTQYSADNKFCPKDGGAIIPEALRSFAGNSYHNDSNEYIVKADIGIRFITAIIDVLIEAGLSVPASAFYMLGVAGLTTNSLGYPVHRSLPIFYNLSFFAYFIPIIYIICSSKMV